MPSSPKAVANVLRDARQVPIELQCKIERISRSWSPKYVESDAKCDHSSDLVGEKIRLFLL